MREDAGIQDNGEPWGGIKRPVKESESGCGEAGYRPERSFEVSDIMIYWAPLLHFYQPSNQVHWVLKKVCNESYRPLVQLFHDLPHAKVTVNINASLTEMLDEHGMSDVINGWGDLAENGCEEFT